MRGMRIHTKFSIVNPGRELAWTGRALWTKAVDRLVLERLSSDATRLYLHESLAGFRDIVFQQCALAHAASHFACQLQTDLETVGPASPHDGGGF